MSIYDDYVWRLSSSSPAFDVQLPQDLAWIDEATWTPVQQNIKTTLSGSLVVQESYQHKGRPLTLQGKEDMGWISRATLETLITMVQTHGLTMKLQYIKYVGGSYTSDVLIEYNVMFRHYEPPPLEVDNVKGFDEFDPTAYFKVRSIKFMEVTKNATQPCSGTVVIQISSVIGTFQPGDLVYTDASDAEGIVLSFTGGTELHVYKTSDTAFNVGNTIKVDASNYATVDSVA